MARDTAPTSYVIDVDPRSRYLIPQIFLSSEAFASCGFSGPFLCDILDFLSTSVTASVEYYSPSGDWNGLSSVPAAVLSSHRKNLTLKTLRARLAVFDRKSDVLSRRTASEASSLCASVAWSLDPELEAMESFHFLSLHRPSVTVRILQLSFLAAILCPARRHGKPFPWGWRIFCLSLPPTPRM